MPLTLQLLRGVTLPPGSSKKRVFDSLQTGLFVEVRQNGLTAYCRLRDLRGRQRDFRIGPIGVITLDQARRRVRELHAQTALGRDPVAERNALRTFLTVAVLADEHYLPDCQQRMRSHQNLHAYIRRIKRCMGSKALDEVTWADVSSFKEELVKEGLKPGTINRHLATLRAMFNWANRRRIYNGPNPAAAPGMLPEQHRELTLTLDQEKALIAALAADQNTGAATALGLLMVTGARKSEITRAEWRHVDHERCELLVPRSKSGKPRRVPLPPVAIDLLRLQRRRCADDERFIFPGTVPGRPVEDLRRIWARASAAAKLPNGLRIHDLRHSMASRLANAGVPLNEIGAVLGHSVLATTSKYVHFDQRRLVQTAAIASEAWAA